MNEYTHLYIAKNIANGIEDLLPVGMSKNVFRLGNIFPDLYWSFFTHPHKAIESADYIFGRIEKLCDYRQKHPEKLDLRFVFRLGIVTHYIADYFCRMHQGPREKYLYHLRYERAIGHYIRNNRELLNKLRSLRMPNPERDCGQIIADLMADQRSYQSKNGDIWQDIEYALRCTYEAASGIICQSLVSAGVTAPVKAILDYYALPASGAVS